MSELVGFGCVDPSFLHRQNTNANKVSVILGKSAINETNAMSEQKFDVTEVIVHEEFDNSQGSFNHDIGKCHNVRVSVSRSLVLFKNKKHMGVFKAPVPPLC